LNKNRSRPLRFGIGLHLGELTYGNVGTPTRIEALCKHLQVDLLVSERVAGALPGEWKSLGNHTLRSVGDKMELFTLP
jgi:adenylate cyclase